MAHLGHAGTVVKIVFDFVTIAPPLIFSFLAWNKLWESKGDPNVAIQHGNYTTEISTHATRVILRLSERLPQVPNMTVSPLIDVSACSVRAAAVDAGRFVCFLGPASLHDIWSGAAET